MFNTLDMDGIHLQNYPLIYGFTVLDARLTCLLLKCSCSERCVVTVLVVVVYIVCQFLLSWF